VGGFQLPAGAAAEQRVIIHFAENAGRLEGRIELPLAGTQDPLRAIRLEAAALHFEWLPDRVATTAPAIFDGRVAGDTITGSVQRGANAGAFAFVRFAESAASAYAPFAGAYRFASGRAIGFYEVSPSAAFPTRLLYADLQTGELGAAFPITGTRFAVGPAVGLAYPFHAEVVFVPDGQGAITGLTWRQAGAPDLAAGKVSLPVEEVRYPGGDAGITLAGRLTLPPTAGRHPAVVIVHGAGAVGRKNFLFDLLGTAFALRGVATLTYDKRGVGESGGTYVSRGNASQQNLERLARDALAGLRYLQGRPEIDPARIGMQGNSQAGWIIPLAAAQSPDVAFMILWSGPGVTQGVSDLYDRLAESMSRADLTARLRATTPTGFDPIPYLERTAAPGLWAFGAEDKTVPVLESLANLEQVKAAGRKDFTLHVFPGGDHFLFDSARGNGDLRTAPGYVPGLFDLTLTWLEEHLQEK
jgi:dienelactone hydrolase